MIHILVVEDDEKLNRIVCTYLNDSGFQAKGCPGAREAYDEMYNQFYDLIISDIMMPGIDGFGVCEKIRAASNTIGIIMLSAKSQEMDKVRGLMTGADDYITKPFSPSELVARVDAIYRRVSLAKDVAQQSGEIVSGPFVLNSKSRTLTKNGKTVDLTQVEFQILEFFMRNPNTALERSAILDEVWGSNYFGDVKIVDVNIRRLRMKIEEEPSNPRYLQTVWGFGYKWVV